MDYLEKYNLSKDDILDIKESLNDDILSIFLLEDDKVISILDYFYSLGVVNIKEFILMKSTLFYENLDYIRERIEKSTIPKFELLIKENPGYLDFVGL